MSQPNLFSFATSELSQDAFLCWLLAWSLEQHRTPENRQLTEASRAFLAFLLSKHDRYKGITPEDITGVLGDIRQQYEKIDVYCVVALADGSRISLIIEDKVETSQHSDQLDRYLRAVRGDSIHEDDLVGIYFKTGLVTEEDQQLPPEFALLRREELLSFLKGLGVSHLILDEYIAYLGGVDAKHRELERLALDPGKCKDALGHAPAQWELMKAIFQSSAFAQAHGDDDKCRFYNGVNAGGTPWTQFSFWRGPNLICAPGRDPSELLMYRLDYRKTRRGEKGERRPYIGLRRYCKYEKTPENRQRTLGRYEQLRKACMAGLEAARASGEFTLMLGQTLSDYSGKFEQELLVFFLHSESNTPDRLVQQIPILHQEIMRRVPEKWPDEGRLT